MSTFRILVADDHPIFRFGLCSLLSAQERWSVCGEAADGREAVEKCTQLKPDLVILDICMPELNGLDAARQIIKDNPSQKIMVLTDVDSEQVIRDCLEAGIRGWLFKSDATADLATATDALQHNNCFFSPRVSDLIMEGYLQRHRAGPAAASIPKLSPREREVVQLLAESKSSKEVALILNVSVKTAETHRSNIMLKLKLHSVAELVLYAVRNEIVHVHLPTAAVFPQRGSSGADLALQRLN
jgi:DNA-binding NarL/FixJ family response regulator